MAELGTATGGTDISHDAQNNRFVGKTASGEDFFVEYNIESGGVLDAYHTFVPPSGRGCGLAKKLCVAIFEFAKAEKQLVRPSCTYISGNFLVKNPEYCEYAAE